MKDNVFSTEDCDDCQLPTSYVPRPSSLVPRPSSLVLRPSSHVPLT